ncbi:MAG: hypothetical protein A2919_00045 [Candidatus Spechtbacteria bacterium RIFCSPLOWO2_01_FULL_43_12]|uniref:Addiction module toxin RelE n=1 Tax=Candidatus Spechtbacteria bacterium RIFCSPLOWO2_01_FULL_43_12 TaxID=1802162 RepID=A0A1G2HF49_9BACT|nr:MAG: hypothetical protein A2919_00045 [Candidatus Spechtbacteria bacterium RIFCSPLOWO2_01_FULL_43_12]
MYKVIFYKTSRGEEPTVRYLKTLDVKVRTKFYKLLTLLENLGPNLRRPYADLLKNKIYELRIKFGSNQYRTLYFFFGREYIVITHGFTKKTDQVPEIEIKRTETYRKDFEKQISSGEKHEPKKI